MTATTENQAAVGIPIPVLKRRWALLWCLHVMVTALAVLSLAGKGFALWVDVRALGWAGTVFEVAWVVATLAVPFYAGPRLGKRAWRPGRSAVGTRRLLWPTYAMLVCLAVNSGYYAWLWWHDRADPMLPMPLVAGGLLGAWAVMTRWYAGGTEHGEVPHRRVRTRVLGAAFACVVVGTMAAGIGMAAYTDPMPPGEADVAVVLGGGLKDDGTASFELAERVELAVRLYKEHRVSRILLSGNIWPPKDEGGGERNEVAAMHAVCIAEGVPDEAIVIDPVSFNTRATAFNTLRWMHEQSLHSAVLCTSNYHLYRTARSFADFAGPGGKEGITLYAMPAAAGEWACVDPKNLIRDMIGNVVYVVDPHYRESTAMTMQLVAPRVVVKKSAGVLELYDGAALKKSYSCISGGNAGDKAEEGDRKTPEGTFHIVYKNPLSKFHLSLGLDYPNKEDAARGLSNGLITKEQYDDILTALGSDLSKEVNQKKLWYTKLGGEIFIHGHGEGRTGTAGCVAMSNPDVEELYAMLPVGTEVVIRP